MYKNANKITPGDEIVVKGKPSIVEYTNERGGIITIQHSGGRFHCQWNDKLLFALSREGAIEEALGIMDAELP